MSEGMPQLIAAEIDSYDQVLQRAIKAEQELAAADAENETLLGVLQHLAAEPCKNLSTVGDCTDHYSTFLHMCPGCTARLVLQSVES